MKTCKNCEHFTVKAKKVSDIVNSFRKKEVRAVGANFGRPNKMRNPIQNFHFGMCNNWKIIKITYYGRLTRSTIFIPSRFVQIQCSFYFFAVKCSKNQKINKFILKIPKNKKNRKANIFCASAGNCWAQVDNSSNFAINW